MSGRNAIVIGGGVAGASAAIALAEAGHPVTQFAGRPGATAMAAGVFDFASASPGIPHLPWRDAVRDAPFVPRERLASLLAEPSHPLARLEGGDDEATARVERLEREADRGLARLAAWLQPAAVAIGGDFGSNRAFATMAGTLRLASHAWTGVSEGDLLTCSRVRVAGVPGIEAWDPWFVARVLAHEIAALGLAGPRIEVVQPAWPAELWPGGSAARAAGRLDRSDAVAAAARALVGVGADDAVLLLPPLLGIDGTRAAQEALSKAAGGRVAEAVGPPPHSPAGLRLHRALTRAVAAAGVDVRSERATQVRAAPTSRWEVVGEEGPATAGAVVVLATGRFAAGGLDATDENVREPLLGLPLLDVDGRRVDGVPARRNVRKGYANPQPLYSAGIEIDARLRPQRRGAVAHAGLYVAGDAIGGFDPARERTGLGTALLTGLRAADAAAAELAESA